MKTPDVTKEEFLAVVRAGVYDAVREMLPSIDRADITDAISDGVDRAMPFPHQITEAILAGVKEAMP